MFHLSSHHCQSSFPSVTWLLLVIIPSNTMFVLGLKLLLYFFSFDPQFYRKSLCHAYYLGLIILFYCFTKESHLLPLLFFIFLVFVHCQQFLLRIMFCSTSLIHFLHEIYNIISQFFIFWVVF